MVLAALATCTLLAACAPGTDPVGCTPKEQTATAAKTPDPTSPPAMLVPDGDAAHNLPLFEAVVASVWATEARGAGRAYIDALVGAGFDKQAMQVTNDQSTVGNAAESLQFSVRWGAECLIGQVGLATGDPVTIVAPALAAGQCLVGATRPIDW